MNNQHDGAPPYVSQVPNQWTGRGSTRNWPPRSPDLNPLDYHVWSYIKAILYVRKVNTRELLQRILSAAKSFNVAAEFRKVTSVLVAQVRKCIQADEGHFEQLA